MKKQRVILLSLGTLFSLFTLVWFALPAVQTSPWFNPLLLPQYLGGASNPIGAACAYAILALAALVAFWNLVSWLLVGPMPALCDPDRPLPILFNILGSLGLMAAHIAHAFVTAKSFAFLYQIPLHWYIGAVFVIAWNAFSIVRLIQYASTVNPSYQEYMEYRSRIRENKSLLGKMRFWGIQRRLVVSFTVIILVIIVILSSILLRDFGDTLLVSVKETGFSLSEHSATFVKSSVGDKISVQDYLDIEAQKNKVSNTPFSLISYVTKDKGSDQIIIKACTDQSLAGTAYAGTDYQYDKTIMTTTNDGETIRFISPASYSGIYLGFIEVEYKESVIMAPLYRTQVKVFIIGLMFIYLAIFIVYLFARNIVIPILFLRMSVNAIADTLGSMIKGGTKVSSGALEYKDRVQTSDEIKGLSQEIGGMTGVIRGLIPYISASTLKAADREKPTTEKKDLCFIFTDIRGFTTLCEGHKPEEVVEMLNHYLEIQSSVILSNNGDIDKFVGDEIMGMFEGPEKEVNACRASLQIRLAMAKERELAELAQKNVISIGIGINSGEVIFGSIGARDRMDFTSIGDTVNLAARLEGANKTYGTKTLITETVYNKVKDSMLCREIDLLTVKGKNIPVRIYEILHESADANAKVVRIKEDFEAALSAYRAQNWPVAIDLLNRLVKDFHDETSEIFLRRIELFKTNPPPADWDGVFNLTVK